MGFFFVAGTLLFDGRGVFHVMGQGFLIELVEVFSPGLLAAAEQCQGHQACVDSRELFEHGKASCSG
ncbi:hypothetical protein D9M71_519680 [compost metagenome]